MGILKRLFGREPEGAAAPVEEQAVIVHLPASGLPNAVYEEHDLVTLEYRLIEAIAAAGSGEYDGNEFGPGEVVLYLYGPDAEAQFTAIEGTLRAYPLSQSARVEIRRGPPGSPQREVVLGG